jgi:hypothetical protein
MNTSSIKIFLDGLIKDNTDSKQDKNTLAGIKSIYSKLSEKDAELIKNAFIKIQDIFYGVEEEILPVQKTNNLSDNDDCKYDLKTFCNMINIENGSYQYKCIKSKMNYDRKIGVLRDGRKDNQKKHYYSLNELLVYTKTNFPHYFTALANSSRTQ